MNLEKSNLKILLANSFGADLEDRMEGEQRAAYELGGASDALRQAATRVPRDLCAKVDVALKEGEIKDGLEALQVASLIKKFLSKTGDFLNHLADVEHQKSIVQLGRVDGLKQAMKLIQDTRDQEAKKVQTFMEVAASDDEEVLTNRTSGSIARAEKGSASDRKAAENSRGATYAAPEAPVEDSPASESTPPAPPVVEDRRAAEQAAREERGSAAERRAAEQAPSEKPRKKKKTAKTTKTKLRAVKRAVPE